jgi:hypothetical protein
MADFDANIKETKEVIQQKTAALDRYKQELGRLNTMFLKGRIDENYYDTEYLRLTDLMRQNEPNTAPQGHSETLKNVFADSWKDMYNELDKLGKKLFWKSIVKEIIVDSDMNVIDVIFL